MAFATSRIPSSASTTTIEGMISYTTLYTTPLDHNVLFRNLHEKPPIISYEQMDIIMYVGYVFLSSAFCIFGIIANIINIIIFVNQGFKSTVNITLCGISISDLGSLVFLQWVSIGMAPLFRISDVPFVANEVNYLTGGLPCVFFTRVTSWYTAFVTIERCLSVTKPLKIKQIITPRRTAIALIVIFFVNLFTFVPEYFVAYFGRKFDEERNKTLIGVVYREGTDVGKYVYVFPPLMGALSVVVVIVFTVILVLRLRQKTKWRKKATHKDQAGAVSTRDKNTMKMIIVLASVLIACNIPAVIVTPVTIFVPDFSTQGAYYRLFKAVWAFPFMFQGVNASVNIFFYYRMSTNYRQRLDQLFVFCRRK